MKQQQRASGELTHLNWEVEVEVTGPSQLELGTYLDDVTSVATCGVQHIIVRPLNERFDRNIELRRRDAEPYTILDYLRCTVNGVDAYVKIAIGFKVDPDQPDYEFAQSMIGVVLAKANMVLASAIIEVTSDDLRARTAKEDMDRFADLLGDSVPSELVQLLGSELFGTNGRQAGSQRGPVHH